MYWCSSRYFDYWDGEFTANGPQATFVFSAKIHMTGEYVGWLNQRIDNVALVEKSVFQAHAAQLQTPLIPCMLQFPQEALLFQAVPPQQLLMFHPFHAGVGPEWDLSDFAHFVGPSVPSGLASAENDLLNPVGPGNTTGGSLGLGQDADNPPDNRSTTSITVGGLQDGREYVLTFWWKCHADDGLGDDFDDLRVDVLGSDPPPNLACSTHKLIASDPGAQDEDGYAVDIDGQLVLAGAPSDDQRTAPNAGAAYVYQLSGTGWWQVVKLFASDYGVDDQFGNAVALEPGRAVVGAWRDDDLGLESGSVYVFEQPGGAWIQQAKLLAPDGALEDLFGASVGLSRDVLAIGAPLHDHAGTDAGAVYVFRRAAAGWVFEGELFGVDTMPGDHFGESVAIENETVVVGAPNADSAAGDPDAGAVYVFGFDGAAWSQQQKLEPANLERSDHMGHAVAISGNRIVAGAPFADDLGLESGRIHVFHTAGPGQTWVEVAIPPPDDGVAGDRYGMAVAIDGDAVIAGARHDDPVGSASGSAYVLRYDGADWQQAYKFIAPDAAETDELGVAVAVDGDFAVAGSHFDDLSPASTDAGSVYVFGAGGDCNQNLVPDLCDIWNGVSPDVDENGIPDECEFTATEPAPLRQPVAVLHAAPNPFNPRTTLAFELPAASSGMKLRVYDARGALVRTLLSGPHGGGPAEVVWDGRDDAGREMPSGVYLAELAAGAQRLGTKLTLVR